MHTRTRSLAHRFAFFDTLVDFVLDLLTFGVSSLVCPVDTILSHGGPGEGFSI